MTRCHHHLSAQTVDEILADRIPAPAAIGLLLDALGTGCVVCARVVATVRPRLQAEPLLQALAAASQRAVQLQTQEADADLARLDHMPGVEARLAAVARSRNRYRTAALVELLLKRARGHVLGGQPQLSLEAAQLAAAISLRVPAANGGSIELLLRSRAYVANAYRVLGQLAESDALFAQVLSHTKDIADPADEAEILSLATSLLLTRGRYLQALELTTRGAALYEAIQDEQGVGRLLVQAGQALFHVGRTVEALEISREAMEHLSPSDRLDWLACVQSVAVYLDALGEQDEALVLLADNQDLCVGLADPPGISGRFLWLSARLAERMGRLIEAEERYRETLLRFSAGQLPLAAAVATLDLARLLLRQGRVKEVQELAQISAWVLAEGGLHQHARTAFEVFHQAAVAEVLSLAELVALADFLQRAGHNPELPYNGIS